MRKRTHVSRITDAPDPTKLFSLRASESGQTAWVQERFPDAPFFDATLDLPVIDPALKKTLDPSSRQFKDVNTSGVVGGRLYMRF